MDDFLIDMAVGVLLRVLADPKKKSKWRRAMLKVFNAIAANFAGDKDFAAAHKFFEGTGQ